jgi:hypothetical protein
VFKRGGTATPEEYIAGLEEPRRSQIQALFDRILQTVPDQTPHMMSGMIAFGTYHYSYASGREGEWAPVALASHTNYISVYVSATDGVNYLAPERYKDRLPKASIGKSCIRFKRLEDIDLNVLMECVREGVALQVGRPQPPDPMGCAARRAPAAVPCRHPPSSRQAGGR